MAQSVERMKIDSENVPLTALAGRTPGRTPNKRATMGGPTFVPPPRMGSSPPSSPLANRSNVDDVTWAAQGARSGYPAQPHHDRRVGSADMAPPPPVTRHDRRQTMAPNMMSAYRLKEEEEEPALMAAPMPPPGGDRWGRGNEAWRDGPAAAAAAAAAAAPPPQRETNRRHSTYVSGGSYQTHQHTNGGGATSGMPPSISRDADAYYTPASSPWGSPPKSYYSAASRTKANDDASGGGATSPPSAPPPPPSSHGYNTRSARKAAAEAPSRPDSARDDRGYPSYPAAAGVTSPSASYLRGLQDPPPPPAAAAARREHATHQAYPSTIPGTNAPPGTGYAHLMVNKPAGTAAGAAALLGAAPEGCYLGTWRGDERARVLAYEACLQACLEGSLGTNAPQHKVDMAVHFLADRCAELRKGFGMDGVLVGSKGDGGGGGALGAIAKGNAASVAAADVDDQVSSTRRQTFDTGCGQRWSGVTVDVTEVSIITRGWKRFTSHHPREVYQTFKEKGAKASAKLVRTTPEPRGDVCVVRADSGGFGGVGGGDSATLHVGCGDARIRLAAADEALVFEVDLGEGKIAKACPTLEEVAKMSNEGRNIVELPLLLRNGKEKGYVRFTAHLEPIGGYDWGAPLTNLDHTNGVCGGLNSFGGDAAGWSSGANAPLPAGTAYDVALNAALRSLGFHRRRLNIQGPWAWLLRELSELQGVSPNHTSLRYVRHVLAVATPTADCLASILDHLAPCLREHAEGRLNASEAEQLKGIKVAVDQLVGVCFQNYKNLSEDEPRGIAKEVPQVVPAPALAIALELSRILQKDPLAPESIRGLQSHLQTAARSCYRRHHSIFLGARHKNAIGGDESGELDAGHARLFAGLSELCLGLCRELGTDHTIQDANVLPLGVRLPQLAAGVYCTEASACVEKLLTAHPPPAPPGPEAIDLVDALCELQEAAVAADVSDLGPEERFQGVVPTHDRAKNGPYPGIGGAPAASAMDPKRLFQPHVASWIESGRETLLRGCIAALAKHGVGGAAMDDAYREAMRALEGFERVVARWPDAAVALEEVLADADRLLLQRISASVDDGKAHGGGLFGGRGAAAGFGGGGARDREYGAGYGARDGDDDDAPQPTPYRDETNEPKKKEMRGAMNRLRARAGKAAAATVEKARSKFHQGDDDARAGTRAKLSHAGAEDGYVPAELGAALTALKAMEVLRPEVGQRLVLWVAAAGGGQRAAGEEFSRRSAEVLGELRAQYSDKLRRAVGGVAGAGPSLLNALRDAAIHGPGGAHREFDRKKKQRSNRSRNASHHHREWEHGERDAADGDASDAGVDDDDARGDDASARGDARGSNERAGEDELDFVVAPILSHVDVVARGLRRSVPQRRALVGVLRGLWSHYGGEALKFVEEDLRQRSSWRLRLIATGACERVSAAVGAAIREALGHDVKDKDLEPPTLVTKLSAFVDGGATESVSVY